MRAPANLDSNLSLDILDIVAFFALFGQDDARADLAAPFGTLDVFDIVAWFEAFGRGCV